jgi:hypothetical protein
MQRDHYLEKMDIDWRIKLKLMLNTETAKGPAGPCGDSAARWGCSNVEAVGQTNCQSLNEDLACTMKLV